MTRSRPHLFHPAVLGLAAVSAFAVGCDESGGVTEVDVADTVLDITAADTVGTPDVSSGDVPTADTGMPPVEDGTSTEVDAPVGDLTTDALDATDPSDLADASDTGDAADATDMADVVAPICGAVDPGAFGACALALGVAFDGSECVAVSGCACEPECDAFFEDVESCSASCLGCQPDKFEGRGIARPIEPGDLCDELHACLDPSGVEALEALVSDSTCDVTSGTWCEDGSAHCRLPIGYAPACRASSLDAVASVLCVVYGP